MAQAQTQTLPAPADKKPPALRQQLDDLKPQLALVLPPGMTEDRFIRVVHTAIQLNPDITTATRPSIFGACLKAATDGLILDGREAALVVRSVKVSKKNEPDRYEKQATYQPMVQGLKKLAEQAGWNIVAHVVYANDTFTYSLGDDESIHHAPAPLDAERGKPIAAYAIAKSVDGGPAVREVMRASEILNIGSQGQNSYQYDPSKGKNYAEWWRKTLIRRICKYLPRSNDRSPFHDAAEQIDEDFDYSNENQDAPTNVTPIKPKKRGGAAAALKDITPAQAEPEPASDLDQDGPEAGRFDDFDQTTGEVIESDAMQPEDDL